MNKNEITKENINLSKIEFINAEKKRTLKSYCAGCGRMFCKPRRSFRTNKYCTYACYKKHLKRSVYRKKEKEPLPKKYRPSHHHF